MVEGNREAAAMKGYHESWATGYLHTFALQVESSE